jgi:ribosome-binding ATPase YchF (GTP1/OBG family)
MKYKDVEKIKPNAKKKIGMKTVLNEMLFKSITHGTGKDYVVSDGDILEFNVKHVK